MAVAQTGARSFIERNPASGNRFDDRTDTRGPLALAAASEIKLNLADPKATDVMRLFVVGDADFISNALLARQAIAIFPLRAVRARR